MQYSTSPPSTGVAISTLPRGMTITEEDVGITEFLRNHEPFEAILKQYIDDFIVNEITKEGVVVEQNSLEVPRKSVKGKGRNQKNDSSDAMPKAQSNSGETVTDNQPNSDGTLLKKENPKNTESDAPNPTVISAGIDSVSPNGPTGNANPQNLSATGDANTNSTPPNVLEDIHYTGLEAIFPDNWKDILTPLKQALETGANYNFPPTPDKGTRKVLHEWIRNNLPEHHSLTVPSAGEDSVQCVQLRKGKSKDSRERKSKSDKRSNADSTYVGNRDFVQCTLWKRGRDTMEALNEIAKQLRIRPDNLSTAGTKDRRGVTVQRLRVKGIPIFKLGMVNKARTSFGKHRNRCVALGDFEVLRGKDAKPLRLGDLRGNRFTLVLRGVRDVTREVMEDAISNVKTYGFINYYGLQRFGSGASPTHHTGFALLRDDYKDACMRILTPLTIESVGVRGGISHKRQQTEKGLKDFTEGEIDAKSLLEILPRWMHNERTLLRAFAADEKNGKEHNYQKAFSKLQRNMQMMYVHAVQSYLWNVMASKRVSMYEVGEPGREYAVEGDIITLRPNTDSLNASTIVRKVSKEEEIAQSIKIDQILIPVIGRTVPVPDGDVGQTVKDIMEREQLDVTKVFNEYDADLKGSYRRLICVPENVEHNFEMYRKNNYRPLVRYGIDRFDVKKRKREEQVGPSEKKIKMKNDEVNQPPKDELTDGKLAYTTLEKKQDEAEAVNKEENVAVADEKLDELKDASKVPSEDPKVLGSEIIDDGKMEEVHMETGTETVKLDTKMSEMKAESMKSEHISSSRTESEQVEVNRENVEDSKVDTNGKDSDSNDVEEMEQALIISFSLSLASYATMLMRELTHKQTDTSHHRKLSAQQLGTEAEPAKQPETASSVAAHSGTNST